MPATENDKPVRILHLEDDATDFELIQATLEVEGIRAQARRIGTREEFGDALGEAAHDLILSDNSLPGFDGLTALEMANQHGSTVPFIFVSGTLGEETAIESLKRGATDYVLKTRLSRLGPAVRRALAEAVERRRLSEAEAALRDSEERLRQAQKMEIVGQLAGGVAHDFNNLLTPIMAYCEFIRERVEAGNPIRQDVDEIERAARRAEGLTRQLLSFCRRKPIETRALDLNDVVADAEKMLRRLISADSRLVCARGKSLPAIKADPGQIEQILMNLVVNARDAMPAGGEIRIETSCARIEDGGEVGEIGPGTYVILRVSDTGMGVEADVLPRIFDPFFTTKEPGKGTGLGLSTVHGIVKQCNGHIEVHTQRGLGTTFTVLLPRAEEEAKESSEASEPRRRPVRGRETILLVEDDETVRKLVRDVLRRGHYAVIEVPSSAEALRFCQREEVLIDLVLADVVMPEVSGPELVKAVHAMSPGTRMLFMTGYGEKAEQMIGPGAACLQKPFTPRVLLDRVREMLDTPLAEAA
jgi:signal transduction histidine kinase